MAQTDLELLDRFRARGDAEAFSEIVRRYASTVFAAGQRILGDSGRAEDVAQETFFRLLRRPEMVQQSLGGWLHRSATRLAVDGEEAIGHEFAANDRGRHRKKMRTGQGSRANWMNRSRRFPMRRANC